MESTTEIFTKLVTIISTNGTSDRAASARMRMSGREAKDSLVVELTTSSGMASAPPLRFWAKASAGCSAMAAAKSQGVTRVKNCRTDGGITVAIFKAAAAWRSRTDGRGASGGRG